MKQPLILTLDSSGQANKWVDWQDAVVYQAKGLVAWSLGEIEFTFHGGKSRLTGEQSTITTASIIAIKGTASKRAHKAPTLSNRILFRRDKHMCAYCGKVYGADKLTCDHIHPVSKGGKNTWTNCVTACKGCNHYKSDRSLQELDMQLLYVPYTPVRAEALLLGNRRILVDQMDFLLNTIPENSRAHDKDFMLTRVNALN